jgi:3-dehydroquinate dehydratase/shikimate dehydrogenase
MTRLIVSILPHDREELRRFTAEARASAADMIELRIDAYDGPPEDLGAALQATPDVAWIVTCRSAAEGGASDEDTQQRVARLLSIARNHAVHVDFEFADWQRSANIREKVLLAAAVPSPNGGTHRARGEADSAALGCSEDDDGTPAPAQHGSTTHRLILSAHDFTGPPADARGLLDAMSRTRPTAVRKLAFKARDARDLLLAFDLLREEGRHAIIIAMGEAGLASRVLAKKYGAWGTFAALNREEATAPGQLCVADYERLRWSTMNETTRWFGVIGDPVAHSRSPLLFNHWFERCDLNAVYLPMRVAGTLECLTGFLDGCLARPWLDVGGFSVTLPHKRHAFAWLGDRVDPTAARIGAVNTIVFTTDGPRGYNTDAHGVLGALLDALNLSDGDELAGMPVDILGAGGAARAAVAILAEHGVPVTIYARRAEQARTLADAFNGSAADWEDRHRRTGRILINATNVGMQPNESATPMAPEGLANLNLVFDMVYTPRHTQLLQDAQTQGIATLTGDEMFTRQAIRQLELWTGVTPDLDEARTFVRRLLEPATTSSDGTPSAKEDA